MGRSTETNNTTWPRWGTGFNPVLRTNGADRRRFGFQCRETLRFARLVSSSNLPHRGSRVQVRNEFNDKFYGVCPGTVHEA